MNMRDARNELLRIRDDVGEITPDTVLEAARPRGSVLHGYVFDKAPKDAAEAYYRARAHSLIRIVRIRYPTTDPTDKRTLRAFHAVRETDPPRYVYEPAEEVAADPLRRALVLRDMERDWRTLKARYEGFQEFAVMILRDIDGDELSA